MERPIIQKKKKKFQAPKPIKPLVTTIYIDWLHTICDTAPLVYYPRTTSSLSLLESISLNYSSILTCASLDQFNRNSFPFLLPLAMPSHIYITLVVSALATLALAINFDLPPGKEECFFEDVHQGTNINGAFVVTQGGSHLDIDVSIFNPDGTQVYNVHREGEDRFSIKADKDGTYKFCFGNTVRRIVSFVRTIHFSRQRSVDNPQFVVLYFC